MERQTTGSIASRNIVSVYPETMIAEALSLMSTRRISSVLVVMHRTAVGIFTERDIVLAANKVLGYPDLQVREVMSSPVLSVDGRAPAVQAYRLMRENGIRHLVVTDPNYDIEGILTQTDLIAKLPAGSFGDGGDISALMTTPVRTVNRHQSARQAIAEMSRHRLSCVVVAEGMHPVGMFTERDVARLFAEGKERWSAPIEAVMSQLVGTVKATISPRRAIERMREKGVRRLVVVDASGSIAGLVTQSDLSRMLALDRAGRSAEPPEGAPEMVPAGG